MYTYRPAVAVNSNSPEAANQSRTSHSQCTVSLLGEVLEANTDCGSRRKAADDQRYILSTETEAVAQGMLHALLAGVLGNVIQITLGVGNFVVDGRRQHAPPHRHDGDDELHGPGCGDQMPEHTFAAAHRVL